MSIVPPDDRGAFTASHPQHRAVLVRRGRVLEAVTLGWNVIGIFVLAVATIAAGSVALAGFALDSLIEIGASTVVLWELADSHPGRQRTGLGLTGPRSRCSRSTWVCSRYGR